MNKQIQRYKDTILFNNPDKIPLSPGDPRESTLKAWHKQGLAKDINFMDAVLEELKIDKEAILKNHNIDVSFKLFPEYEQIILEHKDGHYKIRDWMGAITEISDEFNESYLRSARDFVTRKWHKFPVETHEDWENMKTRYDASTTERFGENLFLKAKEKSADGYIVSLDFNGVFWQLREWCGFENLCILMIENPEFVHEMVQFWSDFVNDMLDRILPYIKPERVFISEDMAYKAHSMISPAMTKEFILPVYKTWIPKIKKSGCQIIELDSDGYIDELIPIWIEAGINCCSPIEVAAHCDIVEFRRKYKKNMAFMQGIDKRLIAKGGKDLEDHIMSIVPALFKEGGYIPGCDHGVPPDISWQNYLEFTRIIAKLSGWL